jgi:hypothetical protein
MRFAGELSPRRLRIIEQEVERVGGAPRGQRNDTLFRRAFALYALVLGGELPVEAVTPALAAAAMRAGLDEAEITRTLRSAWMRTQPRELRGSAVRR